MSANVMNQYSKGLFHIISGIKLIMRSPKLMAFSVIPFLIDLLLLYIGFSWGWGEIAGKADLIVAKVFDPGTIWYSVLYYPLWILFTATFVLLLVYSVFLVATVVAAPFNALLAEEALKYLNKLEDRKFKLNRWVQMTTKMMIVALMKAVIFAIVGLVLFVMSFIPGLNLVAAFLACLIIAFDNIDYSLEIYELSLKQRFEFYRQNITEFSGAASFLALTVLIPGLTLLLLPAAVVGSAEMAGRVRGGVVSNEKSNS
ncbi:MAG: EI24 domain-containing protein [Bdellovibrionales bacterium]|nr:EI24 domain-containing protein [Bdellovibrionales bacterium]